MHTISKISLLVISIFIFSGCRNRVSFPWHGLNNKSAGSIRWKLEKPDGASEWIIGEFEEIPRISVSYQKGDAKLAQKAISDLRVTLQPLFSDYVQPYPGAVTNTVKCNKDDLFMKFEDLNHNPTIFGYWVNANSRWGAIGCNGTDKKYLGFFGVLHCPRSDSVFKIKAYFKSYDLAQAKNFIMGFVCE